jgi:hypothetical protein
MDQTLEIREYIVLTNNLMLLIIIFMMMMLLYSMTSDGTQIQYYFRIAQLNAERKRQVII